MTAETSLPSQHRFRLVRVVRTRPRLFISAAIGLATVAFLFATCDWRASTKLLTGWNIGIALYLALAVQMMARSDVHRMKRRAASQDEGALALLGLTVAAAAASIAAIVAELGTADGAKREAAQLILATVTILLSWGFIHSIFALHYAHEYYGEGRDHAKGGMMFPQDNEPDYWDFCYFSFTVGMCAQTSDVNVTSKAMRRIALVHSIVSFLFNVALLALTVNIAASAI